jgi:hypothetical protein
VESFKDAMKELKDYSKEKVKNTAEKKAAQLSEPAVRRFKEALLHWLQAYSKRSRKHFAQVIDDIARGLSRCPS